MAVDFAGFEIDDVISHEIFKLADPPRDPDLSASLTELAGDALQLFQERITDVVGRDGACILMDVADDAVGSSFQIIADALNCTGTDFVNQSHLIARSLVRHQNTKRIPGGMLVVFRGTLLAGERFIGLIKAEEHTGFSKKRRNRGIGLELLEGIILSPSQRFYKLAIFAEITREDERGALRRPADFEIYLYDHHMHSGSSSDYARYFYGGFLGCKPAPTNRRLTKQFYDNTERYIRNQPIPEDQRADLLDALYTTLEVNQAPTFRVATFAENFPTPLRADYRAAMRQAGVPEHSIRKDLSDVQRALLRRSIMVGKFKLTGPSDLFADNVTVEEDQAEGTVQITINKNRIVD